MAGPPDLLSSIGLCVSVAALLALLANRLRQPLLLAYLLAGVLIGPQIGLGLISGEESIRTVSEIGLILLLFIIGLEMDLKKLLAAGKPVLVAGLLQFPLYLAVCLAMSSTMIVVKLLYDKFELDTLPGRITLGVLVFQDVWAILFLAIQPNLLQPEVATLLGSLLKGILLVAVSLLVSKTVLPRVFQSVAKVPELVLIGSLAWCFIVSAAANAAGLSREMGALIAGVSISTFPYNLDVVAKVVSIRDFFVTLFFVALGMQIPIPTAEVIGLALLASVFLLLSRFVVVFPVLRQLRLGHAVQGSGDLLDSLPVEHDDVASAGLYQSPTSKAVQRLGYASPANAQHERQEFVGERQLVGANSVVRHQDPACQSRVELGARIRDGGVGRLHVEGLNIFEQKVAHRLARLHRPA